MPWSGWFLLGLSFLEGTPCFCVGLRETKRITTFLALGKLGRLKTPGTNGCTKFETMGLPQSSGSKPPLELGIEHFRLGAIRMLQQGLKGKPCRMSMPITDAKPNKEFVWFQRKPKGRRANRGPTFLRQTLARLKSSCSHLVDFGPLGFGIHLECSGDHQEEKTAIQNQTPNSLCILHHIQKLHSFVLLLFCLSSFVAFLFGGGRFWGAYKRNPVEGRTHSKKNKTPGRSMLPLPPHLASQSHSRTLPVLTAARQLSIFGTSSPCPLICLGVSSF